MLLKVFGAVTGWIVLQPRHQTSDSPGTHRSSVGISLAPVPNLRYKFSVCGSRSAGHNHYGQLLKGAVVVDTPLPVVRRHGGKRKSILQLLQRLRGDYILSHKMSPLSTDGSRTLAARDRMPGPILPVFCIVTRTGHSSAKRSNTV